MSHFLISLLRKVSLKLRLLILTAFAMVAIGLAGFIGIAGVEIVEAKAEESFNDGVVPAFLLGQLSGATASMVRDMLFGLQHDPNGAYSTIHDHAIDAHFDSSEKTFKKFEETWSQLKKQNKNAEEQELEDKIDALYKNFYEQTYKPAWERMRAGDFSQTTAQFITRAYKNFVIEAEAAQSRLLEIQKEIAESNLKEMREEIERREVFEIAFLAGVTLISIFVIYLIIMSFTAPLNKLSQTIVHVSETTNFADRLEVESNDEIARAARGFNHLLEALQTIFKEMYGFVTQFDRASEELAALSDKLAKASTDTSDSSSDMAASVEEMTASIAAVGENARETNKNAEASMSLSVSGSEIVNKTIAEMQKMSQAVESSSETIGELGKQSEQISGIVQTIKDVADQTNLLALNAAIEAARAGEQGRGFAVVADEIRKLAERTTRATTEIAAMISAIQESSHTAVASMAHAAKMVNDGVTLAEQAGEAITKIQQGAQQARERVSGITAALDEQAGASHQISLQVERVAHATDENSEAAKSSSQAAEHIASLARSMRDSMAKFKL